MTFLGTSYCFVGLNIELGKKKKKSISDSISKIKRFRLEYRTPANQHEEKDVRNSLLNTAIHRLQAGFSTHELT